MPRQRRKHHSRSRSRSHSHEKDVREAKRRKIDMYDSPNRKRSMSPEHVDDKKISTKSIENKPEKNLEDTSIVISDNDSEKSLDRKCEDEVEPMSVSEPTTPTRSVNSTGGTPMVTPKGDQKTPNRHLTPKQIQKKLESEKKRQQKEKERADREKQKQEEKEKREAERLQKKEEKQRELEEKQKAKEEKEEQRKREKEQKRLEEEKKKEQKKLEEERKKEQKRLEKEEKEEKKRKEEEEKKLKKQQELEEKARELQKEQEKKQKAAAAFVSFFVPKKIEGNDTKKTDENDSLFMPFEVKTDMRLPPRRREPLSENEKEHLMKLLEKNSPEYSYLAELKNKKPRVCSKTWPCEDTENDVTVVEDEDTLGETICEEKLKTERMKAKFLKFRENQRPPYYGTWRKRSKNITGRRPFGKEAIFDYEVDSDDDWEEEEQGESLEVMSDEDKENENEPENEDYEVDNDFFVPHGHLSDDEVDDEEKARLDPETQKQKLKLLKDAFEEDIKSKTQKLKPRAIGCIWYDKDGKNVEEAVDRYLQPLAAITNGQIEIKKRDFDNNNVKIKKKNTPFKQIPDNLLSILVKLVHGSKMKKKNLVEDFLKSIKDNNEGFEISKADVGRHISNIAQYAKSTELTKICWIVKNEIAEKLGVDLTS